MQPIVLSKQTLAIMNDAELIHLTGHTMVATMLGRSYFVTNKRIDYRPMDQDVVKNVDLRTRIERDLYIALAGAAAWDYRLLGGAQPLKKRGLFPHRHADMNECWRKDFDAAGQMYLRLYGAQEDWETAVYDASEKLAPILEHYSWMFGLLIAAQPPTDRCAAS